jgi:hypothetical protein
VFEHYGTPLVDGVRPLATLGLLAAGATLLAAALLRFARKDLTR